jgi:polysaccharide chain length determinant protein (PEP-CTERM system associated)
VVEALTLLWTHVRIVWRFRWLALVIAAALCAVGWMGVVALPDRYEVTTKVFLDTRSILRPLLKGLAIDNRVQENTALMMRRTLLVRPNLAAVARKTDMDLQAKTPEALELLLDELAEKINLTGTERDNIYVISYEHSDPELARSVVEALLNLFVERSLGDTRRDAGKSKQFIDKQIAEYEARLLAAESRLSEFKQQNVGMLPGETQSYYSRLESVRGELQGAKLALEEASRRRDEYRRQLEGVESLFEPEVAAPVAAMARTHPLDARIQSLEANLDQLLLQYTERHPDVVATRGILTDLRKRREEELAAMPAPKAPLASGVPHQNALQRQLSVAAGAAEAEVSALAARVEEFQRREGSLIKMVDTIPRIEAELKRLNRDYDVNKNQYDELLKRREALNISEQANQTTDTVQFNILEPPRVPIVPTGPNRPLFSAVVLVMAFAIGMGIAWVVGMMRPAVYSAEELENAFSVPVLGTVSRVWTQGELVRRRFSVVTFVCGCFVLLGLFGGLIGLEVTNSDLLDKVRNVDVAARIAKLVGGVI